MAWSPPLRWPVLIALRASLLSAPGFGSETPFRKVRLPAAGACLDDTQLCDLVLEFLISLPVELDAFLGQLQARTAQAAFNVYASGASGTEGAKCEPWRLSSTLIQLWDGLLSTITTVPAAVQIRQDHSWLNWLLETYSLLELALVYNTFLLRDWYSQQLVPVEHHRQVEVLIEITHSMRAVRCAVGGLYPCRSALLDIPRATGYFKTCLPDGDAEVVARHVDEIFTSRGKRLTEWRPVDEPTARMLKSQGDPGEAVSISISDAELFLRLASLVRVDKVFVLGNGFGYSTFVLANVFPLAEVVVIDAGLYPHSRIGINFTRSVAVELNMPIRVHRGKSPGDVGSATGGHRFEFAFIDGLHTEAQVVLDFEALKPHMADRSVMVMHDVVKPQVCRGVRRLIDKYTSSGFAYRTYASQRYKNSVGTGFFFRGFPESTFGGF